MDLVTMIRQVLSLLLVFGLLGLLLWKLRRGGGAARWFHVLPFRSPWRRTPASARALQAVERLALTPQHALHLVRVQGRDMVVATHPRGCTLLSEAQAKAPAPQGSGVGA